MMSSVPLNELIPMTQGIIVYYDSDTNYRCNILKSYRHMKRDNVYVSVSGVVTPHDWTVNPNG